MGILSIKNKSKLQQDDKDFAIVDRREKSIFEAWKKGAPVNILALEFQLKKQEVRKIILRKLKVSR